MPDLILNPQIKVSFINSILITYYTYGTQCVSLIFFNSLILKAQASAFENYKGRLTLKEKRWRGNKIPSLISLYLQ